MKQLVIISGKGGTGKTSLSAAFVHLSFAANSSIGAVFADGDVDAANLGLVLKLGKSVSHEFWGGALAEISVENCSGCGSCIAVCRYDAIHTDLNLNLIYKIDPIACDGCAACVYACPFDAIHMVPQQEGFWFQSITPYGNLFHAELFPGRENSGKLVTTVKHQAHLWAEETHLPLMIIDGPPGIGCPVISACTGTDLGLIVTEPGLAGLHDLKRILGTLQHFQIPALICINKADIYPEGASQIREYAAQQGIEIIGEIPFDEQIPRAMLLGEPVTQTFPESASARSIFEIWQKISELLIMKE